VSAADALTCPLVDPPVADLLLVGIMVVALYEGGNGYFAGGWERFEWGITEQAAGDEGKGR